MFIRLKGAHKGSVILELFVNIGDEKSDGHISLIFARDKRVILRLVGGQEIALDPEYSNPREVAALIEATKKKGAEVDPDKPEDGG